MKGHNPFPMGSLKKQYSQRAIKDRLKAFLLDNVSKVVTRQMLVEVSKDPSTGLEPENWHQRLSELRTDDGYTILSKRDRSYLSVGEYVLESTLQRTSAGKRVLPTKDAWSKVLERAEYKCEWTDGNHHCFLHEGDIDPVGGGTVKLTPDHMQPHSINPKTDREDINQWQALCGRHQVIKKNFWDSSSGKINTIAVLQALTHQDKLIAYQFLKTYFGDDL